MIVEWQCRNCNSFSKETLEDGSFIASPQPLCNNCGKIAGFIGQIISNRVPDIPNPPPPPPEKSPTHDLLGVKHDQAKPRWDLLPMRETEEVVHVLTFGAKVYDDDNWKLVLQQKNGQRRYFAALMRHITAWWGGEPFDPETHRHHLAHAVCCCLFLMWFDLEKKK